MLVSLNHVARLRCQERGSVLVISLLLVMIGTFGMTAWFGLIAARSLEVNAMEDAMRRRIELNSVKEIARQAGSEWFLAMDGGKASATTISMPSSAGELTFPAWTETAYTDAATIRYHQIGGVPAQSFSTDINAVLDDGGGTVGAVEYSVQLRTYVPALRGELLTIHEPEVAAAPVSTDAGLLVNGRSVVWDPDNALAHRTEDAYVSGKTSSLSMLNLAGDGVSPENVTFAPRSTGSDFIGRMKKINASESEDNRYTERLISLGYVTLDGSVAGGDLAADGYSSDGAGDISIQIDHPSLPHLHVIGNALTVRLIGQSVAADFTAASGLEARVIVITEPVGSAFGGLSVRLSGENDRPIVVALRQDDVASAVQWVYDPAPGVPFPRWRSIFELENSPAVFTSAAAGVSELHIRGGISTDASIDTSALTLRLLQDTSAGLEAVASRVGYVEVIRN